MFENDENILRKTFYVETNGALKSQGRMNKNLFYLQQSSLIEYGGVEMRLSSIKKH